MMNRSFYIYISELFPEADIRKILAQYDVGLELLQFSISDNLDRFAETKAEVHALLERLDHPRTTVHGPFLDLNPMAYDSKIQAVTMDRFKAARDGALEIGADKVIFHSGMIPSVYFTEGWAERVADFWNDFLKDHSGIKVCMENVWDREYFPLKDVMDAVRHPDFEFCLDAGHTHCYSPHPAEEWARAMKDFTGHIHLHDNSADRDSHLALDRGTVPWRNVLNLIFEEDDMARLGNAAHGEDDLAHLEDAARGRGRTYAGNDNLTFTLECCSYEDAANSIRLLREYLNGQTS